MLFGLTTHTKKFKSIFLSGTFVDLLKFIDWFQGFLIQLDDEEEKEVSDNGTVIVVHCSIFCACVWLRCCRYLLVITGDVTLWQLPTQRFVVDHHLIYPDIIRAIWSIVAIVIAITITITSRVILTQSVSLYQKETFCIFDRLSGQLQSSSQPASQPSSHSNWCVTLLKQLLDKYLRCASWDFGKHWLHRHSSFYHTPNAVDRSFICLSNIFEL